MSRSGYTDDCDGDNWDWIRYRGAVRSAFRGRRGVAFLNDMVAALDALPERRLITGDLEEGGEVCAIGAVGRARGIDMSKLDSEDYERVASVFGVATAMAREIVYTNDDHFWNATPEERFEKVRAWVRQEIWEARGCVEDPYAKRALRMSQRLHWRSVIEWNEV